MKKTKQEINDFHGRRVDHIVITDDDGSNKKEAWLTKPMQAYVDVKKSLGATKIDTNDDNSRLYFFDNDKALVGDYRLSNKLKGKSPSELVAMKTSLFFFESWFPAEQRWVKQVAIAKPKEMSGKAVDA